MTHFFRLSLPRSPLLAFGTLLVLLFAVTAQAQTLYWDINGATAGSGGAAPAGIWDTATARWNNATGLGSPSAWGNTGLETAVFAAGTDATGTYIVTLGAGSPLKLSGITANQGTLTLQPQSGADGLDFGAVSGLLSVASAASLNIAAPVNGTAGITKTGAGTLTLSGANLFAGGTVLNGGRLLLDFTIQNNSKLDPASSLSLAGGTLALTPNAASDTSQTVASTIINSGGSTLAINRNAFNNSATLNLGTLTRNTGGTLNVIYAGTGTGTASATTSSTNTSGILGGWATLNGTDWATNSTNAANGAITALGTYTNDAFAAGNNTTLTIGGANLANGALSTNSLRWNALGARTLTLGTGTKTLTSGGILVTPNVGGFASTISGGNLQPSAGGQIIVHQYNTAGDLTIASVLLNNGGSGVVKTGPGALVLSGANTFTGAAVINQGTLSVSTIAAGGTASNLGAGSSVNLGDSASNGTLLYTGATASTDRGIVIGAGGGTVNVSAAATTLTATGVVSGAGPVVKAGLGGLALAGANTFSGSTSIVGGSLTLDYTNQNNSKIDSASSLTLANAALVLTPNASADTSQAVLNTIISAGANTITINKNAGANNATLVLNSISRTVGSTVNFQYAGTGSGTAVATTSNANVSGILGGWATVNGSSWATVSGGNINALGTFTTTTVGGNTAASYAAKDVDITSSPIIATIITANTLRFNTAGAFTLTLPTGNNTISSSGILVTSGVGGNLSTITGGTLRGPANGELIVHQYNTAADLTIASVIGNNTSTRLVKTGPGNLNLTATNTFTGGLTIDAGTVTITSTGALANNAANTITINNGGTLKVDRENFLGGYNVAINTPVVINAGGVLTNNGLEYNTLGSLTLNGGTLTATGGRNANFQSWGLIGNVSVNGAVTSTISATGTTPGIQLGQAGITSVTFDVADGAASTDLLISAALKDGRDSANGAFQPGSLVKNGAGTLQSTAANTFTGSVTVNSGILQLTNTNVYAGGTTINGGTLLVTGTGTLLNSAASPLTVNAGGNGVLGKNNTFGTYTAAIATPVTINAGGTVSNSGAFFNALGPVTLNGGTLNAVGGSTALLQAFALKDVVTVTGTTVSTISGSGTNAAFQLGADVVTGTTFNVAHNTSGTDLIISAVLADGSNTAGTALQPSSLTKSGAGTLLLTSASTYSGATNITGGTFALGGSGSIAASPAINVTPGALLDTSGLSSGLALGAAQVLIAGRSTAFGTDVQGSLVNNGTLNIGGDGIASTLTISGGLALQNGGQLRFDFGTDGTSGGGLNDLIAVGGALNLSGTTTIVAPGSIPVSGVTYTLITAGSLASGSAANFAWGGTGTRQSFSFDTTSNPGTVYLTASGSAASLTWTGATNATWDVNTTTNWSGAPDQKFFNLDNVTFNDTSSVGAVSFPANVQPLSITVNNSATPYAFSGPGAIVGTTGILKTGPGTLSLSGPNTFTGAVQIQQGTLTIDSISNAGSPGALGAGSSVTLGAAGTAATLRFTPPSAGSANKTFNILAGGGTIEVTDAAGALTLSGVIGGTGPLAKTGPGVLTLSGLNTFTNTLTVSAGTLKAGSVSALGSAAAGTLIQSGATLDVNAFNLGSETVTVSGTGVGAAGAIINSSATQQQNALRNVVLADDTTFGGTGRWDIRGDSLTTGTATLDLAGHTLTIAGSNIIGLGNTTVTNGNIIINSGTLSIEQGTAITGSGTITVNAGGTLGTGRFSLATNVTRPVTLNGGAVVSEANNSDLGSPLTLNTGSTSTITALTTHVLNLTGGISGAGSVNLNTTGSGVINVTNGLATTAGNVTLTNAGTGSINITTAPGNTVAGTLTSVANINIAGTGTAGSFSVGGALVLNGGSLKYDLSSSTAAGNDSLAVGGALSLNTTTTIQVNAVSPYFATGTYTLISGGTSVTGGSANLALTGILPNTRQAFALDTTTIPGSVLLQVTGTRASLTWAGAGAWDVAASQTWNGGAEKFFTYDSVTFDDTSANGGVSLTTTVNPGSVTVNNSTTAYTISGTGGAIAGLGGLTKTGAGVLTLGNANTYSGGSVIEAGEVRVTNVAALGTGSTTLGDASTGSSSTALYLDGTARQAFTGSIVISSQGSGTATLGSRSTITGTGNANNFQNITLQRDVTFDSNAADRTDYLGITGTGNITVAGTNRTVFRGTNTFAGNIIVTASGGANAYFQSGATTAGNTDFIPDTASITVNSGSRYALSSGGETINALNGAGTVDVSGINGTLTLGGANGSGSFTGTLANNGVNTLAIVKTGTGTQALGGANTYTGGTLVSGGTLLANNATGSTGAGAVVIGTGAALGGNGVAGSTTAGSSFSLQNGGTLFAGQDHVQDAQVLEVRTGGSLTLAGTISLDITGGASSGTLNLQPGNNDKITFTNALGTGLAAPDLTGGLLQINASLAITAANWTAGSSWQLFDWSSVTAPFANLPTTGSLTGNPADLPDLSAAGLQWDWSGLYSSGRLSVTTLGVAPEPSRMLLLVLGLCCCLITRRRSSTRSVH